MKHLNSREEFSNQYKINEANYGPFANDITWNDSLLGRLVSGILRKAKTGLDMVRIQPVILRLSSEIENIKVNSVTVGDSEIIKLKNKIIISSLIGAIMKGIEERVEIKELKDITKTTIEEIKKIEFNEKDILLKQLDEFYVYLDEFKTDEKSEDVEDNSGVSEEFLKYSTELLNSVIDINISYKSKKYYASGNKHSKISDLVKNKLETPVINENIDVPMLDYRGWFKIKRFFEKNPNILQSDVLKKIIDSKDETMIINIGKQVVLNKSTLGKPIDIIQLLTEANSMGDIQTIAKSISMLGRIVLAFKGDKELINSFNNGSVNPIRSFITAFDKLEELLPKLPTPKKVEATKENKTIIKSYSEYIKESENNEEVVAAPETPDMYKRIGDWIQKKIDIDEYAIEKTKIKQLEQKIELLSKNKNSVIIDGHHSIFEIVKLFNRAYKIYTVRTITSRTDGKVSPLVYNKYTAYNDSGTINGWNNGPYRNNAIFNQWDNAVLGIFQKYPEIFSKNTKIRLPKVSNPESDADYEIVEKAGENLKKFMTELLDGNKLYKGDSAQKKFIDDYFGISEAITNKEGITFTKNELKDNTENADKIKEIELFFKEAKLNPVKGSFIELNFLDKNEKPKNLYIWVQDVVNSMSYIAYSKSFYHFNEFIKNQQGPANIVKSPVVKSTVDNDGKKYFIRYMKVKTTDLQNILRDTANYYEFGGLCTKLKENPHNMKVKIGKVKFLTKKDSDVVNGLYEFDKKLDTINVDKNLLLGVGFVYNPINLSLGEDNTIKKTK